MRLLQPGFILFAKNHATRNELQTLCVDLRWAGLPLARWWNEARGRAETRQEKKEWYRRSAGAPARGPPTLLPRCPRRVTIRGHQGQWHARRSRRCYRKFTSRLILRATNGLVASPISRMIIIIRGIRLCEQQRAVIEILYSRVIVSAENTVQRFNEEDFTHFPVEDRIASIRCADLPAICSLVDKIDNWQDLRFPARLKVKACNNLVRKLLRCFLRYALGES